MNGAVFAIISAVFAFVVLVFSALVIRAFNKNRLSLAATLLLGFGVITTIAFSILLNLFGADMDKTVNIIYSIYNWLGIAYVFAGLVTAFTWITNVGVFSEREAAESEADDKDSNGDGYDT